MKTATQYHLDAMRLAAAGDAARLERNHESATTLFAKALRAELSAIKLLKPGAEPTWSVLHRSAASLALEASDWRRAEKLVAVALSGEPPEDIADELRDLIEQAHFHRHLEIEGVVLEPGAFHLSLSGGGVARGVAPAEAVMTRVDVISAMLRRTAERAAGRPFQSQLSPGTSALEAFMQTPQAASFAVRIKLARPTSLQMTMFDEKKDGEPTPDVIVDELLACIDLLANGKDKALAKRMGQEYYENFMAYARRLAPDGRTIRQVAFVRATETKPIEIMLRRTRKQLAPRPRRGAVIVELTGRVQAAAQKNEGSDSPGEIHLDTGGDKVRVMVPTSVEELVTRFFNKHVVITVEEKQNKRILLDITPQPTSA